MKFKNFPKREAIDSPMDSLYKIQLWKKDRAEKLQKELEIAYETKVADDLRQKSKDFQRGYIKATTYFINILEDLLESLK